MKMKVENINLQKMTEICTNEAYATHQWHLWQIIILREQFGFFFFFSNLYTGQWRKRRLLGWAVFKCLATCRKSVCRKRKDKKPLAPFYHARSSLVLLTRKLFFFFLKENNGTLLLPSFIWYNQWQRVCVSLKERIPAAMKILNTF